MVRDKENGSYYVDQYCRECGVQLKGTRAKQVALAVPDTREDRKSGKGFSLTKKTKVAKQKAFLSHYSDNGSIGAALKEIGVNYSTYIRWKEDPAFMIEYQDSIEKFKGVLEKALKTRAVDGVLEPVASAGKVVAYKKRYSDNLLLAGLRAADPQKYSDGRKGIGAELSKDEDGTVRMKVYQGFNPEEV